MTLSIHDYVYAGITIFIAMTMVMLGLVGAAQRLSESIASDKND